MVDSVKRIFLDIQDPESGEVVTIKKGDVGRRLVICLLDGGMPYRISDDCRAAFTAEKPGGSKVFYDCQTNGMAVLCELTGQVSAEAGEVACEIKLYGADGKLLTSAAFGVIVEDTVFTNGDPVADPGRPTSVLLAPEGAKVGQFLKVAAVSKDGAAVELETVNEAVVSVPTKVSQLENDSGYLVGVSSRTNSNTERLDAKLFAIDVANNKPYGISSSFPNGSLAHYIINDGVETVYITGWGWESTASFYLYAFLDKDGKIVDHGAADSTAVKDREVRVPENAYELYVNGRTDGLGYPADIEYDLATLEDNLRELGVEMVKPIKLMTLGDSITALGTGNTGWIKYFMEKIDCALVANVAVNGAWLRDSAGTVYDGAPSASDQVNNVLGNQVQKILNDDYEAPDVIMIAIGTNSGISITDVQIKNTYHDSNGDLIPLASVDRTTDAGAYRYCTETLHNKYPDALIIWCSPIMGANQTRSALNACRYSKSLSTATMYSGQLLCDTLRCGINGVNEIVSGNGEYLIDGLHPNVKGAKKIGYFNAAFVKQHFDMII